jgi:hypothetical protein
MLSYPLWIHFIPPYTSDDSIISQQPCAPPCWQGLIPGQSTRDDVSDFVETSDLIPDWRLEEKNDTIWWGWTLNHRGYFRFDDNETLKSMSIFPNFQFPVSDILEIYGDPVATRSHVEHNPHDHDDFIVKVFFYYPQYGLLIEFKIKEGLSSASTVVLSPDMLGYGFGLYPPTDSLIKFVEEIHHFQQDQEDQIDMFIENDLTLGWWGFDSLLVTGSENASYPDSLRIVTPTPSSK